MLVPPGDASRAKTVLVMMLFWRMFTFVLVVMSSGWEDKWISFIAPLLECQHVAVSLYFSVYSLRYHHQRHQSLIPLFGFGYINHVPPIHPVKCNVKKCSVQDSC
uniref:GPI inositol-deacylase n=1 Tax=Anthurium amnicola TaxID=1678845 RepID=A0A1D1XYN0_9ARAE